MVKLYNAEISYIIILNSIFTNSTAGNGGGGVLFSLGSNIIIAESKFENNTAVNAEGGVLHCLGSTFIYLIEYVVSQIALEMNVIDGNSAWYRNKTSTGGIIYSINGIVIFKSEFENNIATRGGVLHSEYCSITIIESGFYNNSAHIRGGVLYSDSSTITLDLDVEARGNIFQ